MQWIEEITIEDINEQYKYLAKIIGIKNFIKLIKELGGTSYYIPKLNTIFVEARNRKITKEYNNYNRRELALKYGISERQISNIINKKIKNNE